SRDWSSDVCSSDLTFGSLGKFFFGKFISRLNSFINRSHYQIFKNLFFFSFYNLWVNFHRDNLFMSVCSSFNHSTACFLCNCMISKLTLNFLHFCLVVLNMFQQSMHSAFH